jgi:hypothetical protein
MTYELRTEGTMGELLATAETLPELRNLMPKIRSSDGTPIVIGRPGYRTWVVIQDGRVAETMRDLGMAIEWAVSRGGEVYGTL